MTDQSTAMKNRCVIQLAGPKFGDIYVSRRGKRYSLWNDLRYEWFRVYGSRSEAKKQLPKWLVEFPDARILPAGEVV